MKVFHLSAECYPVAKVGGLGDVVGSLPKYQRIAGVQASVIIPFYHRKFVHENQFDVVYKSSAMMGERPIQFSVLKERSNKLGFALYLIKIPGLLDREEIYMYPDEREQFISFQIAALEWFKSMDKKPDIIHCHDHHAGLIPFLIKYSARYEEMSDIPTICTVHNGQYQGWMGWEMLRYLPEVDLSKSSLLEWGDCINSLAAAIKNCWAYTTVSPSYLAELSYNSNGLEILFQHEQAKGEGIINGIDTDVWNTETDPLILAQYNSKTATKGKAENKAALCKEFNLNPAKPLIVFIGRLVVEKGADFLSRAIVTALDKFQNQVSFLILGSGEPAIEIQLKGIAEQLETQYNVLIGYDEALSHRMYAGADFLLMPSRVEPCGLNQLYSLRYATIPVVHSTGGLKDTVIDVLDEGGYGICFDDLTVSGIVDAIGRCVELFSNSHQIDLLRTKIMSLDYSWNKSANQYINLYQRLNPKLL